MSPLTIFYLFLKATLLSTGGTGNMPAIQQEFVAARGAATDADLAEALGIGQLAPGPTGLWVVCFGYFVDGVRGALLAAVAVSLPPFVILAVERAYRRVHHHPAIEGFVRGMGLAVAGVSAVVLWRLMEASTGPLWQRLTLATVGLTLMATRRVAVPVIILAAAVAGALLRSGG